MLHTDVIKNKKTNLIYFLLTKHKHFIILFRVKPTFIIIGRVYVLYFKFIMTHFFHFMNRTNLLVCSKTKEKKDCEINVKYIISFVETKENIFFVCCLWLCYPHLVFIEYMCQISIFIFPKPHTKFTINIKYSTRAPPHTTHNTTHRTFEYKIWSRFWYFGTVTIFFTQKTWPHHTPQLFWYRQHFPHSKNVIGEFSK